MDAFELLDAIERRGSFAKAAEELNKATSALSYGIQKLEEQLGITLFQRQGRRSVMTPAGKLLLEEGRTILQASHVLADRARELATGWEPKIRIALESTLNLDIFFKVLNKFLQAHPDMEIDLRECALNGGWEALEYDQVDLLIGAPGPVPQQKGYRAISMGPNDLSLIIGARHKLAHLACDAEKFAQALPEMRRIILHDTTSVNVVRSEGLISGKQTLYVQTIDQKIAAQRAGLGVGHLPRSRIQQYLDKGELITVNPQANPNMDYYIAWKISHKGKALQALGKRLQEARWQSS